MGKSVERAGTYTCNHMYQMKNVDVHFLETLHSFEEFNVSKETVFICLNEMKKIFLNISVRHVLQFQMLHTPIL